MIDAIKDFLNFQNRSYLINSDNGKIDREHEIRHQKKVIIINCRYTPYERNMNDEEDVACIEEDKKITTEHIVAIIEAFTTA
ncbi:hypothetical protein K8R32_01855 [bacterium]|nr:hypothetical protein [bacterium]